MTVQELIDELQAIEDKTQKVLVCVGDPDEVHNPILMGGLQAIVAVVEQDPAIGCVSIEIHE